MKVAEIISTSPRSDIFSYKSLGYSFKTALADIIDNSISAKAKNINIMSFIDRDSKKILIIDDGEGMNLNELIIAMSPGGKDPTLSRRKDDLGRFGLGLKSASFSQCNLLKVVTKVKGGELLTRTWDLNYVLKHNKWQLFEEKIDSHEIDLLGSNGTIVVWKGFDVEGNKSQLDDLETLFSGAFDYCKLIYHKYLEKGKIKIFFNSQEAIPFDPFLSKNNNVMKRPIESKNYGTIQTYILPIPRSNIHKSDLDNYELIKGFNASQGVYVYREDRLIAYGGWFGIFKVNELSKLARVVIHYDNSLDSVWSLDVVKSKAIEPNGSRGFFKKVFKDAIDNSKSSFKEKSKRIYKSSPFLKEKPDELWIDSVNKESEKHVYSINSKNDFIRFYCEENNISESKLRPLLKIISDLIPLEQILENNSENPNVHIRDEYIENPEIVSLAKLYLKSKIALGITKEEAINIMKTTSPFNKYKEILLIL